MQKHLVLMLFFVALQFPINALSWECTNEDKHGLPIEKNIELASDVIVGKVVSGSAEREDEVIFSVKISQALKGKLKGKVELKTHIESLYPEIILGEKYLIMLYGNREIDFCTPVFRLSSTSIQYFRVTPDELTPVASSLSEKEYKELQAVYEYFLKKP
jgi:hypothetical protein